jgi:UDP-GlcNAc:undecaprenyl-phosphate GlcNAc-1-phosphate transferase
MSDFLGIPSAVIAFAVTVIFMFALRPVAKSVHLIDRPGGRKFHIGDVPIIGGLAMFAGVVAGLTMLPMPVGVSSSIMLASLLLVVIGTLDDRYGLPASVRFVAQATAVLIMVYGAGLSLTEIGDPFGTGIISMGPFTLIFTLLVGTTVINAYNLIDGVDGLAGSLALIALLAFAVAGGLGSLATAYALTAAAAIVGFLLFNFPVIWNRPVRSFMGDAGSTLLGFTIVWVAIGASQGPARLISPVICLWFAAIPIYDSLTCFVRRSLARKSPFTPGRDHFHHVLNRSGMGVRRTLGILTGLQVVYVIVALLAHRVGVPDYAMFGAWAVLGVTQRSVIYRIATYRRVYTLRSTRRLKLQSENSRTDTTAKPKIAA